MVLSRRSYRTQGRGSWPLGNVPRYLSIFSTTDHLAQHSLRPHLSIETSDTNAYNSDKLWLNPHEMCPSSSSPDLRSVKTVANMDHGCTAVWLVFYTHSSQHACLEVPAFAARYLHVHNDARDPSTKGRAVWARIGR